MLWMVVHNILLISNLACLFLKNIRGLLLHNKRSKLSRIPLKKVLNNMRFVVKILNNINFNFYSLLKFFPLYINIPFELFFDL